MSLRTHENYSYLAFGMSAIPENACGYFSGDKSKAQAEALSVPLGCPLLLHAGLRVPCRSIKQRRHGGRGGIRADGRALGSD